MASLTDASSPSCFAGISRVTPSRSAPARLIICVLPIAALACTGKYVRPTTQEKVDATPERLERGAYLVNSVMACGACHTPRVGDSWLGGERSDAYLAGGGPLFDEPEMGLVMSTPNVTPDRETGIGAWSDDEILRAIRDGIHRDGSLMRPPMPFYMYDVLSDDDARAVVAYLRSIPPVRNQVEGVQKVPFMLKLAMKMGMLHHKPVRDVPSPSRADKKAYGAYLARIGLCVDCHSMTKRGPDLKGNLLGGSKAPLAEREYGKVWARNLTPELETGIGKYSSDQVKEALRTGKRLDGKPMAPPMSLFLPHISTWTDEDLDALVTYLFSVKPIKRQVPEPELSAEARKTLGL
jgi:mono/diheme cytochrome c family protein